MVELVSGQPMGRHLRIIVTVVTPPVVTLFVIASLSDYALSFADPPTTLPPTDLNPPKAPPGASVPRPAVWRELIEPHWLQSGDKAFWLNANCAARWLPLTVFGVCLVTSLAAALLQCRRPEWTDEFPRVARGLRKFKEWLPYGSIVLVVLAVGATVNLSFLDPSTDMRRWQAVGLIGGVAVLVTVMSAVLSFIPEVEIDSDKRRPSRTSAKSGLTRAEMSLRQSKQGDANGEENQNQEGTTD
jgi:hypothetical protein